MSKKNIIENALISAEELEEAAMDNAKEVMLEAFSPEFTNFFKSVLTEGEEVDDEEDEFEVDEIPEEELEEGSEHDLGKDPDAGRDSTDPSEEAQNEAEDYDFDGKKDDDEEDLKEAKEDDGLPGDQEKIDIDDDGDVDAKDLAAMRDGKKDDDVVNEGEEEEEEKEETPAPEKSEEPAPEKKEAPVPEKSEEPAPEKEEAPSDDEGEAEDLEVPEELFDDEEDEATSDDEGAESEDDIKLSDDLDEDDEELDFDIQDDSEESEVTDTDEFDVEGEEDEIEEGLYIRKEGEFTKITPAEYLNIRKSELEEENEKLGVAISALEGQLSESNLFNAKLANVNKLFESGIATKNQKASFVQKIDECDSIEETNKLFESTMKEFKADYNPLDSFNEILTETRNRKQPENIFVSPEMARMRRMAGLPDKKS